MRRKTKTNTLIDELVRQRDTAREQRDEAVKLAQSQGENVREAKRAILFKHDQTAGSLLGLSNILTAAVAGISVMAPWVLYKKSGLVQPGPEETKS